MGATARAEASFVAGRVPLRRDRPAARDRLRAAERALTAFAAGDLPGALRHLDDAAGRCAELGVAVPDAALDRCAVLLAAGLPADALAGVEAALAGRITATKRAELRLAAHGSRSPPPGFWSSSRWTGTCTCGDGRIRRLTAGAAAEAALEVAFARFGLNRIARGRLAEPAGGRRWPRCR